MNMYLKKLFSLLTKKERKHLYFLFIGMIVIAIIEVTGVGSILPFMSVVSDPDIITQNKYLSYAYSVSGLSRKNSFLILLGTIVLLILVVNNTCTAVITWLIQRYIWMRNHSLSKRLFHHYLQQPYPFFINRNTAELEKNIMDEVRVVIVGIIRPLLIMIKSSVTIFFLFSFLLFLDPKLAIITSVILSGAYALLFKFVNTTLKKVGIARAEANKMRFKIASEAFGGIKVIKVLGREDFFIKQFSIHSYRMSSSQALKAVISQTPKYAFEIIAFGGILFIVMYFLLKEKDITNVIPIISLYAFAGYRLMPALQTVFTGIAEIRYTIPALQSLHEDFWLKDNLSDKTGQSVSEKATITLNDSLILQDISFSYPYQEAALFNNIHINIKAHSTVGITGSTGSGKSTLIDIILGLLTPQSGSLILDGKPLNNADLKNWQSSIGYIPQEIYLSDDTIVRNIGFGIKDDEVNMDAVVEAAKVANLHSFIEEQLPQGYETIVGERGVRLSGGQRQRIGIARALYHNPRLLVLDEATSALDNLTENSVMQAIHSLSGKKTILIIAHRLTTLKACDVIYVLEKGKISASGTFNQLMHTCDLFDKLKNKTSD